MQWSLFEEDGYLSEHGHNVMMPTYFVKEAKMV